MGGTRAPVVATVHRHHARLERRGGGEAGDLEDLLLVESFPRQQSFNERVKLPAGKVLIPGVIESKSNFIEHPELVAQRIARYARLVGRENVIAGSDCGYGTWVGQAAVDPDVVWAKLAALAEGARIASREFWG